MAKILLVDDNKDTLYIIGKILRKHSYEVLECKDGIETLEAAKTFNPDLILLDIRMPRMDGYETCARLKSDIRTKNIPIIIQTATAMDVPDKVRGLNLGATDYVTFPINFDELIARIKTQLRIQELEKEVREAERLKAISEIVLTMHHEINNPLSVIQGWTQMLIVKNASDKETIEALEKIEKSALRIKDVVQKMTRITKPAKTDIYDGGDAMIDLDQSSLSPHPQPGK
ncbi:MAG: response regulator [Candidatus Anammoxibacter sp.]